MFDRIGEWATAWDWAGAQSLPLWAVVVAAAVVAVAGALVAVRAGADGRSLAVVVLVLIAGLLGGWALDHLARRDIAAERRALDARAFELATRALMPGSALACLDAIAGETVEQACERALFASPEATAAAVSYVAAQLSLLASAADRTRRASPSSETANLRRALEADRFGIVAHVLAARDGCTPERCGAFALLQDTSRIGANLVARTFEARVKSHSAGWPPADAKAVASNPPTGATAPVAPGVAARVPNNLYFPSASSIPPVNIMTAEPPPPPHDTTGAAEAATPTPPRKPPQGASRQPPSPNNAPPRAAPMPLAPAQ